MKAEILKELFRKGLNGCEKITRKISSLPVLQNVLINSEGNFLYLTTTNLETTIQWKILAKIHKKGQVAVPATFLTNVVGLIRDEKITMEALDQNLVIFSQDQETQIQGQDPAEFPIIPKVNKNDFWQISINAICQAISQVADIPSISQIRPEISGVYFLLKAGQLKLVATDSFRLAEKTIKLEKEIKQDCSFILPQAAAKEALNIFNQEIGNVSVFYNPNQVLFETAGEDASQPQVSLLSRLIDGEYPNYQEIMPKKFVANFVANKDEFTSQIKKAGLFSGRSSEVQLKLLPKEGRIKLFSQNVEMGKNDSSMASKIAGEPISASFNYKFLLDGLNSIKSSEIVLELSENEGPGVLRPVGDNSFVYILMPIKQ